MGVSLAFKEGTSKDSGLLDSIRCITLQIANWKHTLIYKTNSQILLNSFYARYESVYYDNVLA